MSLDSILVGLCIIVASIYVFKTYTGAKRPKCHGGCSGCHGAGQCHPKERT